MKKRPQKRELAPQKDSVLESVGPGFLLASAVPSRMTASAKSRLPRAPRSCVSRFSRKVGSWERRSASLTSSYPAKRLYIDCRKQVGQRQLGVLAPARIGQVPLHERAQAQTFVQLAQQNQTTTGSHSRTLELDPQRAVERELKGLFLRLTHWLTTSAPPPSHPKSASIRALPTIYQFGSQLGKWKSGLRLFSMPGGQRIALLAFPNSASRAA